MLKEFLKILYTFPLLTLVSCRVEKDQASQYRFTVLNRTHSTVQVDSTTLNVGSSFQSQDDEVIVVGEADATLLVDSDVTLLGYSTQDGVTKFVYSYGVLWE